MPRPPIHPGSMLAGELEAIGMTATALARQIGVTAIPTFVFNERLGMVGAQELPAFREMMKRVGQEPKSCTTAAEPMSPQWRTCSTSS